MSSSDAARRARLTAEANPGGRLDYLVTLTAAIGAAQVTLRYVPDRLVLAPCAFAHYAAEMAGDWPTPEALAIAILHDVNNEVVPRWLQVDLRSSAAGTEHAVAV